ncbi:PaaI family thioesterase [Albimonas sp. CAU 1670]|uniref:PaaI family thioesterase n=1 Tax=Albimonas sp. CAU 1670 TaxID=3032599 RepID=UPI0023D997D3|nr:PaaI family thioesterase [Albimonas sp. CAU 1670]MDF2234717.1 PaaI family thioesterase [Albimonas sp. CAU 1670]
MSADMPDPVAEPIPAPPSLGYQDRHGLVVVEKRGPEMFGHFDITPDHLNRQGIVHGGVYATMLDAIMTSAGTYADGAARRRPAVTVSMTVNFTGRASEGRVALRSRLVQRTSRSFTAEAQATAPDGTILAHALGSFRYSAPPAEPAAGGA